MIERSGFWNSALAIATAAIVGAALVLSPVSAWIIAVGLFATGCWLAASALLRSRKITAGAICAVLGMLAGALVAAPTQGLSIVPAAVCALLLIAAPELPVWLGAVAAAVCLAVLTAGTALLAPGRGPTAALTMGFGLVIGVLAGLIRRSSRRAAAEADRLREERIAAREAEGRIALARDLHDVLAHSLGGLTLQLDAVEALLESGRTDEARARVAAARQLAGQGLADARGAVAALRTRVSAGPATEVDPSATIDELLTVHETLARPAAVEISGRARAVSAPIAEALVRALQEALSNTRRHAPGEPVEVRLDWHPSGVDLQVTNRISQQPGEPGGHYGLRGMGERFAALPLGGWARAEQVGGQFVVSAHAELAPASVEET